MGTVRSGPDAFTALGPGLHSCKGHEERPWSVAKLRESLTHGCTQETHVTC